MSRLIVSSFGISIDGFGAGPDQSLANPLGAGEALFTGIDSRALGFECSERVVSAHATHVVLTKRPALSNDSTRSAT